VRERCRSSRDAQRRQRAVRATRRRGRNQKRFFFPPTTEKKDNSSRRCRSIFETKARALYSADYFVALGSTVPLHANDMTVYTRLVWFVNGKRRART
jgi:hypothetical protein